MRALILKFSLLLSLSTVSAAETIEAGSLPVPKYDVSFVNILTRPDDVIKIDGRIRTIGYLKKQTVPFLYLSHEHAMYGDRASAVPLILNDASANIMESQCFGKFVGVVGQFVRTDSGEYGIENVAMISELSEDGWGLVPCWLAAERTGPQ